MIIILFVSIVCFALAFIYFRKDNVAVSEALVYSLKCVGFRSGPKLRDIYTKNGIYLIFLGYIIGFFYMLSIFLF
jgi:hypothetical protein